MSKGDEPAFPQSVRGGCTKRELFAAMAMQGILATGKPHPSGLWTIAREAVEAADALIDVLEETEE